VPAIRPNEDLRFVSQGYTVILEGSRDTLSEALAAATAFLWEEESRKKATTSNDDKSMNVDLPTL